MLCKAIQCNTIQHMIKCRATCYISFSIRGTTNISVRTLGMRSVISGRYYGFVSHFQLTGAAGPHVVLYQKNIKYIMRTCDDLTSHTQEHRRSDFTRVVRSGTRVCSSIIHRSINNEEIIGDTQLKIPSVRRRRDGLAVFIPGNLWIGTRLARSRTFQGN